MAFLSTMLIILIVTTFFLLLGVGLIALTVSEIYM